MLIRSFTTIFGIIGRASCKRLHCAVLPDLDQHQCNPPLCQVIGAANKIRFQCSFGFFICRVSRQVVFYWASADRDKSHKANVTIDHSDSNSLDQE